MTSQIERILNNGRLLLAAAGLGMLGIGVIAVGSTRADATLWPGEYHVWGMSGRSLPIEDDCVIITAAATIRHQRALSGYGDPVLLVRPVDEPPIGWCRVLHAPTGPGLLEGQDLACSDRSSDLLCLFTSGFTTDEGPIVSQPVTVQGRMLWPAILQWIDFVGAGSTFGLSLECRDAPIRFDALALDMLVAAFDDPGPAMLFRAELVLDDFARDMSAWTVIDQGDRMGPSDWSILAGALVQRSQIYSEPVHPANLLKAGTVLRYDHGGDWTDYCATCTVRSASINDHGMLFRMVDENNYYRFSWSRQGRYSRLIKVADGQARLLADRARGFERDRAYRLQVAAHDDELTVSVDGQTWLQAHDDTLRAGTIGLYCWAGHAGVQFDDLVVEHDFRPVAQVIIDPNTPDLVQPVDSSSNGARLRRPVFTGFADDFDRPDLPGWSVVDQGDQLGPSHWHVEQGQLVQTARIYSEPTWPWALTRSGTFLQYRRGTNWGDYEFSCAIRCDGVGDYGVMFRLVDANNYYRFSWSPAIDVARLVKVQDGRAELLGWRSDTCPSGQTRTVRVVVAGSALRVYVDGQLYLHVVDAAFPRGTVGLYTWAAMPAVFFDEVRVKPAL